VSGRASVHTSGTVHEACIFVVLKFAHRRGIANESDLDVLIYCASCVYFVILGLEMEWIALASDQQ
jgi:hypothetical protein